MIEAEKLILPVGGERASVVALDISNGDTVWTSGHEPASYSSAFPITWNGRRCVVTFLQNALALFDLDIFTWPVCLFVAHQLAVNTVLRANQKSVLPGSRWLALLATCFLVAVCLGYFLACRRLGLPTEWMFLLGFLPSWPVTIPLGYRSLRPPRPVGDLAWTVLSFSALFWSAGALLVCRAFIP